MIQNIFIVGAGNVATHLSVALQKNGFKIDGVYSRSVASAKQLSDMLCCGYTTDLTEICNTSDAYIISVSDNAVANVVGKMAINNDKALFIHTAGSIEISVFDGYANRYGVMYPMQTFSKSKPIDISKVYSFIEGNTEEATDEIRKIAEKIFKEVRIASSEVRKQIHLAAVFANNFANHCFALPEKQLQTVGLPFEILQPLIEETVDKLNYLCPTKAQTGPAVRQDYNVIKKHIDLISDEKAKDLYLKMSESIINYSKGKIEK